MATKLLIIRNFDWILLRTDRYFRHESCPKLNDRLEFQGLNTLKLDNFILILNDILMKLIFGLIFDILIFTTSYVSTILPLFLVSQLGYSEQQSKVIFHTYMMLVYLFPIFGSVLADNWFGKFNIVLYLSLVYASGNFLLATASGLSVISDLPKTLALGALFLISFSTGGIKPCAVAFGGDQYVVPEQEQQLKRYFSIYYFMCSSASLISTFVTPILAKSFHCYNRMTCYPLAFGVAGVLMLLSFLFFVVGKSGYVHKKPAPGENIIWLVIKCICSALKNRMVQCKRRPKPSHFVDYASSEEYSESFKDQVKAMLKVLFIFVAYPIFWALFDQKASNWIFLAKKMDRKIFGSFEILPDHMLLMNSLLTVILIPVFEVGVYPIFAKINLLKQPLERMIWGAVTLALGFVCASVIYYYIEDGTQLHILWLLPQYVFVTLAEVLFSVTGVEFAYTDAPESMKSVIQAIWLLTSTIGNFIFVFISEAELVRHGAHESIFYTILMFFDILLLIYLSKRYVKAKEKAAARAAEGEMANKLI